MGGQSKSQTIGYDYSYTGHYVVCLSNVDKITKITMRSDDKVVWSGSLSSNATLDVTKPNLFGGRTSQGGAVGSIDVMFGRPSQTQNSYLAGLFGAYTPSYRGVFSFLLKTFNVGMNPTMPEISIEGVSIHNQGIADDGVSIIPQWYDEKSEIINYSTTLLSSEHWDYKWYPEPVDEANGDANKAISIDLSGWTLNKSKSEVPFTSDTLNFPVETLYFGATVRVVMWYRWNFTPKVAQDMNFYIGDSGFGVNVWLNGNSVGYYQGAAQKVTIPASSLIIGGNNVLAIRALGGEPSTPAAWIYSNTDPTYDDFVPRQSLRIESFGIGFADWWNYTYGLPGNPAWIGEFAYYAPYNGTEYGPPAGSGAGPWVGVTIKGELTDGLGHPAGTDLRSMPVSREFTPFSPAILNTITFNLVDSETSDKNPVHIIRESYARYWGDGKPESLFPDDVWQQAADTIYNEGFGMTANWSNQSSVDEWRKEIQRHINAETYVDRKDGLIKIKLIRPDYDIDDLIVLNKSNIKEISDFKKPSFGELVTTITFNFTDIDNNWTVGTGTLQNSALAIMQGKDIAINRDYKGFTNLENASRKVLSDLRIEAGALFSCSITVSNPDLVKNLNKGDPFKLQYPRICENMTVMRVTDIDFGDGVNNHVVIKCGQDVFTMPEVSIIATPPNTDNPSFTAPTALTKQLIQEAPYLELVQASGQANVDAQLSETPESGYIIGVLGRNANATKAEMWSGIGTFNNIGTVDFAPYAVLDSNILLDGNNVTFNIVSGTDLAQTSVGKWLQIDGELFCVTNIDVSSVTAKRGCLDTVPAKHYIGASIWFWDDYALIDSTEYVIGNNVLTKLLSVNPVGVLDLTDATAETVTIAGRAARPYNMANVKLNGNYYPASIIGNLVLTWANRNRLSQTSTTVYGFNDANITPETGVTYTLKFIDADTLLLVDTLTGITGTTNTVNASTLLSYPVNLILEIFAVRDGIESFQKHSIQFINENAVVNLITQDGDNLITQSNDQLISRSI